LTVPVLFGEQYWYWRTIIIVPFQSFYMCTPNGETAGFLCPNGTIFNQQYFVCDWWYNIDCAAQPDFYSLNEFIYQPQTKPNCQTLFCKDD
jgi:hypothetical protein